ncbi:hypothetical protein GmRootV213_18310 [Variovorax sp. V213]
MAWHIEGSKLVKSDGKGVHWTTTYGPGDDVPVSGIYLCLGCGKEVTCNQPDKFPPQNKHQHTAAEGNIRWKLNIRTNTEGA